MGFMRALFIVNSSGIIGSGHFSRCMNLALYMQKYGWEIIFLSTDLLNDHQKILVSKEIKYLIVPKSDLESKETILRNLHIGFHNSEKEKFDWLIIDDYDIGPSIIKDAYKYCRKLLRIEDLHVAKWDCDLVVDMNYRSAQYITDYLNDYQIEKILIGPQYALLDSRFELLHSQVIANLINDSENVKVFLNFGSLDVSSLTLRMLRILIKEFQELNVKIVIQRNNVDLLEIEEVVTKYLNRCKLYVSPDFLGEIMASCSISIGAGGISIWERFSVGLTGLVVSTASNQKVPMEQLANDGYISFLGQADKVQDEELLAELSKVLELLKSRRSHKLELLDLVDGKGAQRVYERMMKEV
jgi:UDP-2,4-diacetamido-2,4,6-trideoxy-beta-L-altropyranose hydrolase